MNAATQQLHQRHSGRRPRRALSLVVLVLAVLVYANVSQSARDAELTFAYTDFVEDAEIEAALAARREETVVSSLVEYVALVVAGSVVLGNVVVSVADRMSHRGGARQRRWHRSG